MELRIYKSTEPILRVPTEEVESFDMELQGLIDNMVETMRQNAGIGLSAPQVGVSKRILVVEYEGDKKEKTDENAFPLTIICNPKVKHISRKQCKMVEGCLSFPGMEIIIKRPKEAEIEGYDRYGNNVEIKADKLLARVVQHEIDHLNSTLMVDHLEKVSVIFFGSGSFGVKALESMAKDLQYNIVAVVTGHGGKAMTRGKEFDTNAIKLTAKKLKLPLILIENLKDEQIVEKIRKLKPDLGIVSDFGFIIPQNVINIPQNGILNIHPSLLPLFRGSTPIQSAILAGVKKTGVTIMLINEKVDDGPILSQATVKLRQTENYQVLHDHLSELGAALLLNTIPYYLTEELKPISQDIKKATYTKMIKKEDGEVKPQDRAELVERKIRAFSKWPKVYTIVGDKRIQLVATHIDRERKFVIDRVKPEGKTEMAYEDFKNGYHTDLTFSA